MARIKALSATRRRRAACLAVMSIGFSWIVTATWGASAARSKVAAWVTDPNAGVPILDEDPSELPGMVVPPPYDFVGNASPLLPFLVRVEVASHRRAKGNGSYFYVIWVFGVSRIVSWRFLWQYERHDGIVHGWDARTNTLHLDSAYRGGSAGSSGDVSRKSPAPNEPTGDD